MSTPNFRQPNLSKIYAIEIENDWDYDDSIENALCELNKIKGFYETDNWIDNNRKAIGAFDFDYYDWDYKQWDTISIHITIESGYYEGAMIDVAFDDLDNIEQTKKLEKQIDQKCNIIEKTLKKITTPIVRVALFSNGEAIYERATNEKTNNRR